MRGHFSFSVKKEFGMPKTSGSRVSRLSTVSSLYSCCADVEGLREPAESGYPVLTRYFSLLVFGKNQVRRRLFT